MRSEPVLHGRMGTLPSASVRRRYLPWCDISKIRRNIIGNGRLNRNTRRCCGNQAPRSIPRNCSEGCRRSAALIPNGGVHTRRLHAGLKALPPQAARVLPTLTFFGTPVLPSPANSNSFDKLRAGSGAPVEVRLALAPGVRGRWSAGPQRRGGTVRRAVPVRLLRRSS